MCFFFKQKTAYEMRISDWSSDVCSSDLRLRAASDAVLPGRTDGRLAFQVPCPLAFSNVRVKPAEPAPATAALAKPVETAAAEETGRASCRERVCQYV